MNRSKNRLEAYERLVESQEKTIKAHNGYYSINSQSNLIKTGYQTTIFLPVNHKDETYINEKE